jgi:hypothetical protein
MSILNRETLKNKFGNGKKPSGNDFSDFIDSVMNKVDDGISKNMDDGLSLSTEEKKSKRLISFFEHIENDEPDWTIELSDDIVKGLEINEPGSPANDKEVPTRLFFQKGGNIGVNTRKPLTTLHVEGILGTSSRIGIMSTVPADGEWHDIVPDLDGCHAFEVVAQVGKEKAGKYALLHATAISTFGKSHSKINCTQAHYGFWWNKLAMRFTGSTHDYSLQIKTRSNYGKGQNVKLYITKLWDNDIMSLFN